MTNQEEWNEFLENLFSNALESYRDSKEYKYLKEKQEQMNMRALGKSYNDVQAFLEEYTFEMGLDDERKTEFVYRQGIKDCVWILKNLGLVT